MAEFLFQGQRQNARAEQQHAAPAGEAQRNPHKAEHQGREHGRAAAHDGVAQGKVRHLVGFGNADVIRQVAAAGKRQEAPGAFVRHGQERQNAERAQTAAQGVHGGFKKLVVPAFDDDVPGCVQQGRAEHKKDDLAGHGRRSSRGMEQKTAAGRTRPAAGSVLPSRAC